MFRHGTLVWEEKGWHVYLTDDQSPAKVKPFSGANSWVHISNGRDELLEGQDVLCYALDKNDLNMSSRMFEGSNPE